VLSEPVNTQYNVYPRQVQDSEIYLKLLPLDYKEAVKSYGSRSELTTTSYWSWLQLSKCYVWVQTVGSWRCLYCLCQLVPLLDHFSRIVIEIW
jgi:hypothetical protein